MRPNESLYDFLSRSCVSLTITDDFFIVIVTVILFQYIKEQEFVYRQGLGVFITCRLEINVSSRGIRVETLRLSERRSTLNRCRTSRSDSISRFYRGPETAWIALKYWMLPDSSCACSMILRVETRVEKNVTVSGEKSSETFRDTDEVASKFPTKWKLLRPQFLVLSPRLHFRFWMSRRVSTGWNEMFGHRWILHRLFDGKTCKESAEFQDQNFFCYSAHREDQICSRNHESPFEKGTWSFFWKMAKNKFNKIKRLTS